MTTATRWTMGLITVTLSVLLMMRMILTRSVAAQMIGNTVAQYLKRIVKLQQHGLPGHQREITGRVGIRGLIGVAGILVLIGPTGIQDTVGQTGTPEAVIGIPEPEFQVAVGDLREFPNNTN